MKVLGDAVFVPLTRRAAHEPRRYTLVDVDDFPRVNRSKWYAERGGKSFYALATSTQYLPKHHKRLHGFVLRLAPGEIGDHVSGDTLDNRKQNLRLATQSQNGKNKRRPTFPGKTSRFKGVCWSQHDGAWLASIQSDGVRTDLGLFDDEARAAEAYDYAAATVHGEFARTNAAMKLFEQEDPFVPDCSFAQAYDRFASAAELGSVDSHIRDRLNYDKRLTAKLKRELAAAI